MWSHRSFGLSCKEMLMFKITFSLHFTKTDVKMGQEVINSRDSLIWKEFMCKMLGQRDDIKPLAPSNILRVILLVCTI